MTDRGGAVRGWEMLRPRWAIGPARRSGGNTDGNLDQAITMNAAFSFHDVTIQIRVQIIDPAAVLSHPAAMHFSIGPDGHLAVYTPGTIEEAVVSRFTAMMDACTSHPAACTSSNTANGYGPGTNNVTLAPTDDGNPTADDRESDSHRRCHRRARARPAHKPSR